MKTLNNKKPTIAERVEKTRQQAKKEIAYRGSVQYRLDEETMLRLMAIADKKKVPLGVLARMWLVERLDKEENSLGLQIFKHAV